MWLLSQPTKIWCVNVCLFLCLTIIKIKGWIIIFQNTYSCYRFFCCYPLHQCQKNDLARLILGSWYQYCTGIAKPAIDTTWYWHTNLNGNIDHTWKGNTWVKYSKDDPRWKVIQNCVLLYPEDSSWDMIGCPSKPCAVCISLLVVDWTDVPLSRWVKRNSVC